MLDKMDEIRTERVRTFRGVLFPSWSAVVGCVGGVLASWTKATDVHESFCRFLLRSCSSDEVIFPVEDFSFSLGEPLAFQFGVAGWCEGVTDVHVFRIP